MFQMYYDHNTDFHNSNLGDEFGQSSVLGFEIENDTHIFYYKCTLNPT